ncbi:hypothetical protein [Pseudomonas putida]|uniref:hypothetical protein n=1 Tax=Pseudomonas putida TaxID=303 RepID=UPI003A0FC5D1
MKAAVTGGAFTLPVAQQGFDQVQLLGDDGIVLGVRTAFAQGFGLVVEGDHVDIERAVGKASFG